MRKFVVEQVRAMGNNGVAIVWPDGSVSVARIERQGSDQALWSVGDPNLKFALNVFGLVPGYSKSN